MYPTGIGRRGESADEEDWTLATFTADDTEGTLSALTFLVLGVGIFNGHLPPRKASIAPSKAYLTSRRRFTDNHSKLYRLQVQWPN